MAININETDIANINRNANLQRRFATRAFYMQHIAPYEYAKIFCSGKVVLDAGRDLKGKK